jgi:hypothetical protein
MRKRTIDVYNCDHCNKMYQRKHACEQHERDCFKNPANHRPCLDCMNLTMIEQTIYGNDWMGGEVQTKEMLSFAALKELPFIRQRPKIEMMVVFMNLEITQMNQCQKHATKQILFSCKMNHLYFNL